MQSSTMDGRESPFLDYRSSTEAKLPDRRAQYVG